MKKIKQKTKLITTLIIAISFAGCGPNAEDIAKMERDANIELDSMFKVAEDDMQSKPVSSGNCDEFLNGYEEYMDQYIAILKRQKANPTDMSILSEYTTMAAKAGEWTTKTKDCATDPKFATKYTEIAAKMANAMSGM